METTYKYPTLSTQWNQLPTCYAVTHYHIYFNLMQSKAPNSQNQPTESLNHQGLRHLFGIGGTGTVGAQLEIRRKTHQPRKFRFSSDFVHFILGILGKK